MSTNRQWFEVDQRGLAATIEQPERAPLELYQNAVDEPITRVDIVLKRIEGRRGVAYLTVEDDSPNGFADLSESYVLYAPSKKRDDATKRGRMNVGEKRLLSLCNRADIQSTTGTVTFNEDGTRARRPDKRQTGTRLWAEIRLKADEVVAAVALLRSVIPPIGVTVTVNEEEVPQRQALHTFHATLPTVLPDESGNLTRKSRRQTRVSLFEPLADEEPTIMEMGIPVVDGGTRWIVDVDQRVPLNTERDNVPPAFLRELRTLVLNEMEAKLTPDDAQAPWVQEAIRQPNVAPAAVATVIEHRFGPKVVAYDPSDREANNVAVAEGYTVVHGRSLPKETWAVVREHQLMQPAGQVTPSNAMVEMRAAESGQSKAVPSERWTPEQTAVVIYAEYLGLKLLGFEPAVGIHSDVTVNAVAWYGHRTLTLNVGRLGHRWFDEPDQAAVDQLLIHEFAHEYASNHLEHDFHDACCRLGAKMRDVTLTVADMLVKPVRS